MQNFMYYNKGNQINTNCYYQGYRGWITDREDWDTTDRVFQTWYVRSELVSITHPIGKLCKITGWRQQLNAHECVVNEVTVLVEYLKYALKAIERLVRAHSDLIVGVFAAGQPICTDTERGGGKKRKTDRRRMSVSGRRMEQDPAAFLQEMRRRMEAMQAEIEMLRAERDAAGGAQANRQSSARAHLPPIVEMPETEPDSEEDTDPNPGSYYQGGNRVRSARIELQTARPLPVWLEHCIRSQQ
ncbi:hypothetical protein LR48_Vigan07g094200 [Vigna angularis]|uniref:Uncharacterized protein n=1 Tax=Phaseolus angularis TaxID=3914 RepID=A0A0L9UWU3_PHAAN|nr:hypothetical protein LR48_Vigan07g094200 [Vigna angularis]